jgi:hypothetical protein
VHAFLISKIAAACSAYLIMLDLIRSTILGAEKKLFTLQLEAAWTSEMLVFHHKTIHGVTTQKTST